MRVLVTGGTGFTGSHLVRRLLQNGDHVHVLDYNKGLFFDELQNLGAKIQLGSIADRTVCREALDEAQPEVVYHLAAAFREINVPKSHYWAVNVDGTRHLVESAQKDGVRKFVYCSTQGVHGDVKNPPGNEDSPIAPEDYYQYTKYEGEKVVNEIVAGTGFDATTVRPTAIYGPGDPARFLMLFKRCKTGSFPMFGDGQCTYHPLYIDNLVDCFLLAAEKGKKGEAYLSADAHYYTIEELVKRIGRAMGIEVKIRHYPFAPLWAAAVICEGVCAVFRISPPLFRRRVEWFRQVRAFTIDKARRDLGYEPKVGIDEGLERTAKWYRDNRYI